MHTETIMNKRIVTYILKAETSSFL